MKKRSGGKKELTAIQCLELYMRLVMREANALGMRADTASSKN
jgi:hypothetical protein